MGCEHLQYMNLKVGKIIQDIKCELGILILHTQLKEKQLHKEFLPNYLRHILTQKKLVWMKCYTSIHL